MDTVGGVQLLRLWLRLSRIGIRNSVSWFCIGASTNNFTIQMTNMPNEEVPKCGWCTKGRKGNSGWEQQTIGMFGKEKRWMPLCKVCANRRLNNPYNALLGMRKVDHAE